MTPAPGRTAAAALLVGLPVLGVAATRAPTVAGLLAALAVAVLFLERPRLAFAAFTLVFISTPAYLRLPLVIGGYAPPASAAFLAAVAGCGLGAWLSGAAPPRVGPRVSRALAAWAVFAAVAAASLIDPRTGSEGVGFWIKVFVIPAIPMAAVLCLCRGPADVERVWRLLILGAVAASLFGFYEKIIGYSPLVEAFRDETNIFYFRRDELFGQSYRAFSVFGNPIEFGATVGMIAPAALVGFATAASARGRLLYAAAFGALALGVFSTVSRGPILGFAVGCGLVGLVYPRLRAWLAAGAAAAAVGLAALWPMIGFGITERLRDFDNVTLRYKLWDTAIAIFRDHPLTGVGLGNFPQYYIDAIRTHRLGPFVEFGEGSVEKIRVAENAYFQLGAETGVMGLAAAAVAFGAFVAMGLRQARAGADPAARDLAVAMLGCLTVYAVNGVFITAYTHYFPTTVLIGYVLASVAALEAAEARPGAGLRADPGT